MEWTERRQERDEEERGEGRREGRKEERRGERRKKKEKEKATTMVPVPGVLAVWGAWEGLSRGLLWLEPSPEALMKNLFSTQTLAGS